MDGNTKGFRRAGRILLGMLAGNAVGALLIALVFGIAAVGETEVVAVLFPSLLLVPCAIGLMAGWVWRPLKLTLSAATLHSLVCTLISVFGAWIFYSEGIICLIIAFPLLYAGVLAGVLIGRVNFRQNDGKDDTLNLSLLPLLLLAVLVEPFLRRPARGVVTDEIRIAAPPARVWSYVLAFPEIPEAPRFWLFRLGLPYPVATTNGGNFVGAQRACQFNGNAIFEETVVELVPDRRLTFDIVKSPPDPELLGHLDAQRGQFELRANDDGSTTLIGRTWYILHMRPTWYFDKWTHHIFRAVHLRVMDHIKRLAESPE